MKVNLYYAPYPYQKFEGEEHPIVPIRALNPKSALVTLASGMRKYLKEFGVEAELQIIDTQIDDGLTYYKSIQYGPRRLDCFRVGGEFDKYNDEIRQAQIHGISNNYTNSAGIVTDFAKHIKSVHPEGILVAGGMDASARPEWYLENGFDIVVLLEGEYTFSKVVEAIIKKKNVADLVSCRMHGKGIIVQGGPLLDMNTLPPMSFDLVKNLEIYTDTGEGIPPSTVRPPFACLETSRGCYQRCSYCATPMRGRYRYMSPEVIDRHFAYYRSIGINNLLFQEDNILSRMQLTAKGNYIHDAGRAEVIEIFQAARRYGFSWEFCNGLEFGKFLDLGRIDIELMDAMFWSDRTGDRWKGCYRVQLPLEFLGDNANMVKLPKLRPFEQELEILKALAQYGVTYQTFNVIIGFDGDDHKALDKYLERSLMVKNMLEKENPDVTTYFNIFTRTLLPGTADFKRQKHLLKFDIDRDPEIISVYISPMDTEHLAFHEITSRRWDMTAAINGSRIDQYDGSLYVDKIL